MSAHATAINHAQIDAAFTFTPENMTRFQEILTRYPVKRAALLPALWLVQRQLGWISRSAMIYVGGLLDLHPSKVYEVVTFYTMYQQLPVGKYHIQVCRTLPCMLRGAKKVTAHLKEKLGIGLGETTADKKFTLSEVECLGSCGTAPMFQLNDDFYENLTPAKIDEVLANCK